MRTSLLCRQWLGSAVFCLILIVGSLRAQAPTSTEVPAPTIRVSTHMVLVDVVVTDKQGKPVTGLKPEDFVIEENGKQQKVAAFTTPGENSGAPPTLPPGIYSNLARYRSPGTPVTVLLLDSINTPFKDQAYARLQMLRFAKENLKPDQRIAVMTLTGRLNVLQDFTSDPRVLYTALQNFRPLQNQYTPASGTPPSGPAGPNDAAVTPVDTGTGLGPFLAPFVQMANAQLLAFSDVAEGYAQEERIIFTLNALNSLSRMLGGLPGRKNVIWVTGDLPLALIPEDRTVTQAELEEDLPSNRIRGVNAHAAGNYAATARMKSARQPLGSSIRRSPFIPSMLVA